MHNYVIVARGRECGPGFNTLEEAKAHLKEIVAEDMQRGTARFGQISKLHTKPHHYRLVIGPRCGYNIYSEYNIIGIK